MTDLRDANLSRLSASARARALGLRPDVPCPEASEWRNGLEAYHRGAPLDMDQPIAWRHGWRAGQGGRQLPERGSEPWAWLRDWNEEMRKRGKKVRA